MNDQILQDVLRRLARLEQTMVRYRAGEITDVAPLDVALGGSDVSYEDVKAIGPVANGDQVATLLWGNDLLVLGALARGVRFGTQTLSWAGGTNRSASPVITHGLGHTPVVVLTGSDSPSSTWFPVMVTDTYTATTFTIRGITSDNSSPAAVSATAYWVAIG